MTDIWTEATRQDDDRQERFDQARRATMHQLAGLTAELFDASSLEGFEARLDVARPRIDAVISSATYSDPVLFAQVQDDTYERLGHVFATKLSWKKQAASEEWVQTDINLETYPGLTENKLVWELDASGGYAWVMNGLGQSSWLWGATARDGEEGEGVAGSLAEAQGKASEFLSNHSQLAGQLDMFAARLRHNTRKTAAIKQAATEQEVEEWFNGTVLAEYVEMLTPLKPLMVYGPNYRRGVMEKIGDAMRAIRTGGPVDYNESVLAALVGTVLHNEQWYYDQANGVYTPRLDGTMGSKADFGKESTYDDLTCRACGTKFSSLGSSTHTTADGTLVPKCPSCGAYAETKADFDKTFFRTERVTRRDPLLYSHAKAEEWAVEVTALLETENEASLEATAGLWVTAVRHEGQIHWAVSDESGEEEVDSGAEQTLRDALEQARNTIDQVLQSSPGGGGDAPQGGEEATPPAESAPEAPQDASEESVPSEAPGDAPEAEAPVEESEAPVTEDPVDQQPEGEDAPNPAADTEPLAEENPAADDMATDEIGQESTEDGTELPDESDQVADEIAPEAPSDTEAEEIVDSADETSDGEVTGLDPKSMQVGDRVNMTYTLTDGTTGDVDVTFVREDNDIYFFDGPNGEFGIGEREEDGGTVWVDSEGQHFAFADGDALEEVTGEDVPDEAVVDDVDLEAPVQESAPPAEEGESDDSDTPSDDEEDDEDFKEKFASILAAMKKENPEYAKKDKELRSLARRAARLSFEIGPIA